MASACSLSRLAVCAVALLAATSPQAGPPPIKVPASAPASAPEGAAVPLPIRNMVARGHDVRVIESFPGPSGLHGYVLSAGKERRVYYVTADGQTLLYGLAFDADLNNLTASHFAQFAGSSPGLKDDVASTQALQPLLDTALQVAKSARGTWVEGRGLDVYVVFDPACPFCHRTYRDTRQVTDRLRLHWIPVGELGPRSKALSQSFLQAADKGQAIAAAMSQQLAPAEPVTSETIAALAYNAQILSTAGVKNVPLLLYVDQGKTRHIVGAPSRGQIDRLLEIARSISR